jgi:DNA-binding CsgD family transcriptional regulator/tetratricopeptide (TPR) repeat protein
MQNNKINLTKEIYFQHLETINGVKFTQREIDIIAFLLCGRAAKKIASFLSIAPKTVEAHTRNIMQKLSCNSREIIIDFVEKAGKFSIIKEYYLSLLAQAAFEQKLKEISTLKAKESPVCLISTQHVQDKNNIHILHLKESLKLVTIRVLKNRKENYKTIDHFIHYVKTKRIDYVLYLLPKSLIANSQVPDDKTSLKVSQFILKASQNLNFITLLLPDKEASINAPQEMIEIDSINFEKQEQYSAIFEILKRLLPTINLSEIISEFNKTYKNIYATTEGPYSPLGSNDSPFPQKKSYYALFLNILKNRKLQFFLSTIILCLSVVYVLSSKTEDKKIGRSTLLPNKSETGLIQSDLPLPAEATILKRDKLIKKIEEGFKDSKDIQIIALAGIGGSGKTTLARQYASSQKFPVVWEINAETRASLIRSFEGLAYALSRTEEEEEVLKRLKNIKNIEEKEEKLLLFVKEHLKAQPNWFLLYDNVGNFADIQKYFPTDSKRWGKGKVVLTTKDSNIGNNTYIDCTVDIGELLPQEKLTLFNGILRGGNSLPFTDAQIKRTENFLRDIPSLPLDVSIAAYYIKATNLPYEKYSENLKKYDKDFEDLQASILKEVSYYNKTRYTLITFSFQQIINTHKDFAGLLLLISLVDSLNIPIDLLKADTNEVVVDNFIYHLKKYSLTISRNSTEQSSKTATLSFHRSVQTLGCNFLLKSFNEEEKTLLFSQIISSIESFYNLYAEKDYTLIFLLLPHLEKLLENIEKMELPSKLKEQYTQRLYMLLGYAYKRCSRNLLLEKKYFSHAYELQGRTNHLSTLKLATLLKDLGATFMDLGCPDEAIIHAQKSLELCYKISDSAVLITDNFQIMGYAYTEKNDFKKAEFFFKEALKTISHSPSELGKESESDVYAMLGWLYSTIYLNGKKAQEGINYIKKALKLVGGDTLFHDTPSKTPKTVSRYVARHRTTLGDVYCRAGKYEEALNEGFKEAQYIIDSSLDNSPHYLLRIYIAIGLGEIYLRQGKIELAKNKLTESILGAKKLMGEDTSLALAPLIFCAEAKIRLGELTGAYEDCLAAFKTKREGCTNYSTLLFLTAHYHAAIIKYKQGDLKKAMIHFCDFFKEGKIFFKFFLDDETYHKLEKKRDFDEVKYQEGSASHDIKQSFLQSEEIFSSIYGADHPFVQNYVTQNSYR